MNVNLKGKNILLTGSAKRIGRTIANAIAENGGNIALHYHHSSEDVLVTHKQLEKYDIDSIFVQGDISKYDEVTAMKKEVEEKLGSIDYIVNNAGWVQLKSFFQYKPEEWKKETDICFHGVLNLAYVFLPTMKEKRHGKLINVVGDSARTGDKHLIISSAARSGAISFMQSLAREVGEDNIQCNTISLGMIDQGDVSNEHLHKLARNYPLKRIGTPEDITGAVLFLLSDSADWITGQVLSVNGGYSMIH